MKKIISLILTLCTITTAWAQGGSGQGFDPSNPPDPQSGYRLDVKSAPENGGTLIPSQAMYLQEGQSIHCEANERLGYKFRAWMVGDSLVSEYPYIEFRMPAENVVLTAWFDKSEFNPANPGDPYQDGYTHKVSVYCNPSSGGWIYNNNFLMQEGEERTLYVYTNPNFKFSCWKQDGKIISTERTLPIKMGSKNLEYTAQLVFDPSDPGEPWPNLWNKATGELIIDHFEPGNLWNAISDMVDGDYESVSSLTVIGKIDNYDLGVVRNLSQLTVADFSRTSGADFVPGWCFYECERLTKLLLPSSIREIYDQAFYGCQNLSELVVYASTPPTVFDLAFYGVPENLVVKVYSGSVGIYSETEPWSNYKILTIDEDSTALSVKLPEDASDGRYRNAALQLSNLSTGQTQKLVVTGNRVKFIFGNLIPELKYSLYVISPNGQVIGKYLDFVMPKEGYDYQFESLLQLQDVRLSLTTPEGADVADDASISWFDDKHSLVGSGSLLTGQVEGYDVSYEISIPRELGISYSIPENGTWTVKPEKNVISIPLSKLATSEINGKIKDASTGEPIAGAYVTVSQKVNGQFDVASTTTTDKDGSYTLDIYEAPGSITVGASEYIEMSEAFKGMEDVANLTDLNLKLLYGTEVTVSLLSRDNIDKDATDNAFTSYDDYANVVFSARNLTKDSDVAFRMRYPKMILLDQVDDGDRIEVTATPKNSAFNGSSDIATITKEKGDVKITFTANGDLITKYGNSEADEVIGLLYDKDGKLYKKSSFSENQLKLRNLPDGDYTLVVMVASRLFSSVGSLAELKSSKLTADKDYLLKDVKVETGFITHVDLETIPVFDESLLYYTGGETSISVNKTSVTVGAIVTVKSKVEILPEYANKVEKVNIIFSLPAGCDYIDNSLLVAGSGANFVTTSDGRLSVEVPVKDASPRFCITPRRGGDYRPSAMIEFEIDGEIISQPIGSTLFTAGDFTISVPQKTSQTKISARGTATALSEVKIYDNDVFIGSTRSLTNGDWRLKFDLYNPGDYSEHLIYAVITTPEGVKYTTTTGKTIYDNDWAELTDIYMINGGTNADFNQIDATTLPGSYSYAPGNDMFTFKAKFHEGQATKIKGLDFLILLSDGSRRRIDGKYIPSQDAWVCATNFNDINRLPVNVKVFYVEKRFEKPSSAREIEDNPNEIFRCPDIIPIIDPSGYVYEAVPSNRLEGVTATIFYKELAENMYGEIIEKVTKWDAEAYAQSNPLFTDADGMYQWDVPQGEWQVRFEKEGYETATTEWLPVPPPQLDVNVGMTQTVRPEVKAARAYSQAIEVEFDKYMDINTLTNSNIVVTVNDSPVSVELSFLDKEENPADESYASSMRIEAAEPFASETVHLIITNKVTSYAGIRMEEDFSQDFTIEPEIKEVKVPEKIDGIVGKNSEFTVEITPYEAVANKHLIVTSSSPIVSFEESEVEIKDGKAVVKFQGALPGMATLTFKVEDSKFVSPTTAINVSVLVEPASAPQSSIENGSEVKEGATVELTSDSENAEIWYTTDGSDPSTSSTSIKYTSPIVIDSDITIKAYTTASGYLDSDVVEFRYTVKTLSGVDIINTATLELSPLPSNVGFRVSGVTGETSVGVYDLNGKLCLGAIRINEDTDVMLYDLTKGVYVVRAMSEGSVVTLKFVKD